MTATLVGSSVRRPRDHERALRRLPSLYADAYRLHEAGVDELGIAIHLEIPVEDVGLVVWLAEAQLEQLVGR